jgi:hypothetical protein
MDAAFQAAINQARVGGMDVVWGETGLYLLSGYFKPDHTGPFPLDCTFTGSGAQYGINFRQIRCPGSNMPPNTTGGILVIHNLYTVFDLTGCNHFAFYDLSLVTGTVSYPKTCFLTARNSIGGSNLPRFNNTTVVGLFSNSVLYNYASEDGIYIGNYWVNYTNDANSKVVRITSNNISALTSAFVSIYTGNISTTDHQFLGGQYFHLGGQATSDVFELEACTGLKVYGTWMACNGGRSYFYVNMTHGPSSHIRLRDIVGEDAAQYNNYGIYIGNEGSGSCSDWAISDCYFPNALNPVYANPGATLYGWNIQNLKQQLTHALVCTNMSYSSVNFVIGLAITISGTSLQNYLVGDCSNLSVTTRSNDIQLNVGSLSTGWGTPTGGSVVPNFPGAGATTAQCGQAIAEIIATLKSIGILRA